MKGEHYFELEPGVYIIIIKYYGKGGGYGRWGGKLNMKVQGEKQKRGKGKNEKEGREKEENCIKMGL